MATIMQQQAQKKSSSPFGVLSGLLGIAGLITGNPMLAAAGMGMGQFGNMMGWGGQAGSDAASGLPDMNSQESGDAAQLQDNANMASGALADPNYSQYNDNAYYWRNLLRNNGGM